MAVMAFFVCTVDFDLGAAPSKHLLPAPVPSATTIAPAIELREAAQPDASGAYYKYMHSNETPSQLGEEHTVFVAAKTDLRKQHHSAHVMVIMQSRLWHSLCFLVD